MMNDSLPYDLFQDMSSMTTTGMMDFSSTFPELEFPNLAETNNLAALDQYPFHNMSVPPTREEVATMADSQYGTFEEGLDNVMNNMISQGAIQPDDSFYKYLSEQKEHDKTLSDMLVWRSNKRKDNARKPTRRYKKIPAYLVREYDPEQEELPSYDYILPDGPILNFTAVEIIVFLPKWFYNQCIAQRFCSNGMTAPTHFQILNHHRNMDPAVMQTAFKPRMISTVYLDAMRGHDWRTNGVDVRSLWSRARHSQPEGWNADDISVNSFMPDRIRELNDHREPRSVPFTDLMRDVKVMPQGADAGDLTRAIQYAMQHAKSDENGDEQPLMFPDDIHYILNKTGRTKVTINHADGMAIARFQRGSHLWQTKVQIPAPSNAPLDVPIPDAPYLAPPPSSPDQDLDLTHNSLMLDTPYSAPAPVSLYQDTGLLHNSLVPEADTIFDPTQALRSAQRPEEVHNDWQWGEPEHVEHMYAASNSEQQNFEQMYHFQSTEDNFNVHAFQPTLDHATMPLDASNLGDIPF